jgi:hypothetical protein
MTTNLDSKQAEIERIEAAVKEMVKLMNGSFELDHSKLQAFSAHEPRSGPPPSPDHEDST